MINLTKAHMIMVSSDVTSIWKQLVTLDKELIPGSEFHATNSILYRLKREEKL